MRISDWSSDVCSSDLGVGFTAAAAATAIAALLARDAFTADAIFAGSDLLAMGAIQALSGHGIRVPEAVSVVGYDDTPMGASFVPALSSVHQDLYQGDRKSTRLNSSH